MQALAAAAAAVAAGCSPLRPLQPHPKPVGNARAHMAPQVVGGLAGAGVLAGGSAMQFAAWAVMFAARYPNRLATLEHETYMTAWADPAIHFYVRGLGGALQWGR
jgi:hypothetical protein